jgi:hypothetical protein
MRRQRGHRRAPPCVNDLLRRAARRLAAIDARGALDTTLLVAPDAF